MEELDLKDLNLKENGIKSKYGSTACKPYNNSKYANSLFMYEFSNKMDETTGVTAYSVCPGLCATNLFKSLPWYRQIIQKIAILFMGFSAEQVKNNCLTYYYYFFQDVVNKV